MDEVKKSNRRKKWLAGMIAVLLVLCVCLSALWVKGAQQSVREQKLDAIRENVLSAAVQCYAVEGVFPPDLEYLETRYGLVIDRDRYVVTYDAFSTNIMPDVTVLVRGEG